MAEIQTLRFENVALYRRSMFGVSRTDCKTLDIVTGQHYAQYTDAIRYQFVEKRRSKLNSCVMAERHPWMRVVESSHAIEPEEALIRKSDGCSVSRYSSCDPRYVTDFEDKLAGVFPAAILFAVGRGERELCMRCIARIATTHEGGSHVCGPCASAIRDEDRASADADALEMCECGSYFEGECEPCSKPSPLLGSLRTESDYDDYALSLAAGEGMVACEV